jgi:hypothetical protein
MNISLAPVVHVSTIELVIRFNVPITTVPAIVAFELEADIYIVRSNSTLLYGTKHQTDYFETPYQGPKLNIARVDSPQVLEAALLLPVVHSNAHKMIAGFFLSPDPEVT